MVDCLTANLAHDQAHNPLHELDVMKGQCLFEDDRESIDTTSVHFNAMRSE